jgi:fumarylpyruvate hydrolase
MIETTLPSLPIRGSAERYPVRRILCIGQNYADHAREMGADPDRAPPFYFEKHPTCVVADNGDFPYPGNISSDVHHEVEAIVAIGTMGSNLSVANALDHVVAYGVGIDMTARDIQAEAKKLGRPWDLAKGFDHSAPMSELVMASDIGHPENNAIALSIDGETRQSGTLDQMIWSIPELVSRLSQLVVLHPGDVIMTGTPAGVGPINRGQKLVASVEGVAELHTTVV